MKIKNTTTLAVDDVSFQVAHGSFIGIMGASGLGKTTLLNLIGTIDKITEGRIEINERNITFFNIKINALFPTFIHINKAKPTHKSGKVM